MNPVTERALLQRIRRALADGESLRRCNRRSRAYAELGDFYIVDPQNSITATHCDLEALGHELGVLAEGERVAA